MKNEPDRWRPAREAARRVLSKLAALLLLTGVAVGTGLLVMSDLPAQVPVYGESSIGHVAPVGVRLSHDFDIPDPAATERNREAAVAEVRPVYDLDVQLQQEVENRVAESFAFARAGLRPPVKGGGRTHGAELLTDPRGDLRGELIGRLQTPIDGRDFQALVEAAFSPQIEEALSGLLRSELSQLIIEDRVLLPAERDRGILVRPLPDGAGEVVTDLDALRDLPAARAEVERLAEAEPQLSPAVRRALGHIARGALRPNLVYDAVETARRRTRAREEVAPVIVHLSRGEQILAAGERIDARHLFILDAIRSQAKPVNLARMRTSVALLAALLCFLCYRIARASLARAISRRDAFFLTVVLLATLALAQGILELPTLVRQGVLPLPDTLEALAGRFSDVDFAAALPYAMPVAAGAIVVRLFLGPELTGLFAVLVAVLFGLLRQSSFALTVFALAGGLVGGRRARNVVGRRSLLRVGAFVASTNVGVIAFSALFTGRLLENQTLLELGAGVFGGLFLTPLAVAALAPVLELAFGYVRDSRLAELCNLNHPALKDLIVRAPGTYHHSIILAGLAEVAAEAIGANPLMARAIGLYHDLGKGKAPLMFSENQKLRGEPRTTDDLPEVLRRHVADGVEVARRYRLPRPLLEAIEQHHGTRTVGMGAPGDLRYAGPKPQRRETALTMLADAVEAQCRRFGAKDIPKVPETVGMIVNQIAAEGQLDETDLKLGDLPRITAAFSGAIAQTLLARGQEPAGPMEVPVLGRAVPLDLN